MPEDKRYVVIDTDFFRKVTNDLTTDELFLKIMDEMKLTPIMHEFIFKEELHENSLVKELKNSGVLKIYSFCDYLNSDNLADFEVKFMEAYKKFNFQTFGGQDICSYRKSKESLGEIHSSLMAWYMNMDMMMSDDGEAKHYVLTMLNGRKKKIKVFNIYDTLKYIGEMPERNMKWKEIKGMAHKAFAITPKKFEEIREIWVEKGTSDERICL